MSHETIAQKAEEIKGIIAGDESCSPVEHKKSGLSRKAREIQARIKRYLGSTPSVGEQEMMGFTNLKND